MKRVLFWTLKAGFSLFCSVLILSAFCMLYVYDGIHIETESGATDYNWESEQYKATMKEGFSWLTLDSYGYNNVYDYSEKPDVLLIGSSQVEGLQVDKKENMGYLLNQKLDPMRVYNIGMSGHTIYRCVDNLENATNKYNPQKYVVLVIDEIDLNEDSMKAVIDGTATAIPSYDHGIMYTAQKIPFVKTAYSQITEWISLDEKKADNNNISNEPTQSVINDQENVQYNSTLSDFLDFTLKSINNSKLIIAFQPSQTINSDGSIKYSYEPSKLKCFSELCEQKGITFCDLTSDFQKLYQDQFVLAHGFSNTAVGVGHLNKYGHKAIADTVANVIMEMEK